MSKQARLTPYLVFLLFVFLSIVAGWQVLSNLGNSIIGFDNDVYINPWADWWTLKALTDPSINLWTTGLMFYPTGANLAYHSFSHLNTTVALLLQPMLGDLAAYNFSIWLNYPFIGFSMYLLARYLTKSETGAILAGIAFAFSSHAMYQSSHPVLLSIWCFPLATLYLFKAIDEEKRSFAVWAGVFVFLGTATSTLLFFMMIVWFALMIVYLWIAPEWKRPSLPILLTFAATSGLLTAPLLSPLIFDAIGNQNSSFIIDNGESIVQDIIAPLAPHWLLWFSRGIYFGFVGIYIMLFARQSEGKIRLWVILMVFAYLVSIGPRPELLGRELDIVLPWSYLFVPILRNMYRFNILISMGVSVLIAFGWIGMQTQIKTDQGRQIGFVILLVLLFADYAWPQIPIAPAEVSTFYTEYLEDVDDNVVLTKLPSNRQFDKLYMYFQTYHGHPMTNGVISRAETDTFAFIESNSILAARQTPEETPLPPDNIDEALGHLSETGVGLLVFNKEFMDQNLINAWKIAIPLTPIYEDGWVFVYDLQ